MKDYKKPQLVAKNLPSGSYAAGCPAKDRNCNRCSFLLGGEGGCIECERTK